MTDSGLSINDLTVELGGRRVLDRASLAVLPGELLGLLGPNGAGKTTLLRSVLGLVRPQSGSVAVDGRSSRLGRSGIGYVPQRHEFAWDFPISVASTVMTGLSGRLGLARRPSQRDWAAVAEALDRTSLGDLAERPIGQLSGGQRQRVLVARALVLEPRLLLLDEPFTGLDLPTQESLSALFGELAREGRAVLMTTHDLASAIDSCTTLALLNRTIVATGEPRELAARSTVWAQTFGVSEDSAILRMLRAA